MQLEFKFKDDILMKYSNKINFNAQIFNSRNGSQSSEFGPSYIPMVFKGQALPEFSSEDLALAVGLLGTVGAVKLSGKKRSRRNVLGISALEDMKYKR